MSIKVSSNDSVSVGCSSKKRRNVKFVGKNLIGDRVGGGDAGRLGRDVVVENIDS